jgi:hypothetical protein
VVPAVTATAAENNACCHPSAPSTNVRFARTVPSAAYSLPVWVPVFDAARQYRSPWMKPLTVGVNFRPSVSPEPFDRFGCCGASVVSSSEQGQAVGPDVVNVSEYACVWTTPSEVVAPVTVTVYAVAGASADDGVNVRVLLVSATVPATAPEGPVRVTAPVPGVIASLNVIATEPLTGTDRAPLPGEALSTAGGGLATVWVVNTTSTK